MATSNLTESNYCRLHCYEFAGELSQHPLHEGQLDLHYLKIKKFGDYYFFKLHCRLTIINSLYNQVKLDCSPSLS
jgi:hypothetical protein